MRVVFLTNQLEIGGIERNIVRLTRGLVERGHEVVVATRGGILVDEVIAAGGRHVDLDVRLPGSIFRDVERLRRLVREFQPDVIHAFSATTAALAWVLKRSGGARTAISRPLFVSSIMGLQTDPRESSAKVLSRAYATTLGADVLVVMAPAIADVVRKLRISPQRLVEMWVVGVEELPPVDADEKTSIRRALDIPLEVPVVMTIGRLDASKSHDLFIRAAAEVLSQRNDVRFLIVGGGPLRADLELLIERLGVGSSVELLGERLDAPALLAAADLYIRPGTVEGFVGITALEAQMRRVPVIAFETEDVKMAVRDGETGVLVRNGDPSAMAAAILDTLKDPARANELALAGSSYARGHFGLERVVENLESLYQRATSARSR